MKKKIVYTLEFFIDKEGTPGLQEKWPDYDDAEIESKFNSIQLDCLARRFTEKKDLPHFRKLFDGFIACLIERVWKTIKSREELYKMKEKT